MNRIIVGNTTATPYPRPDWNQPDETKADYIKNKPNIPSVHIETQDSVNLFKQNTTIIRGTEVSCNYQRKNTLTAKRASSAVTGLIEIPKGATNLFVYGLPKAADAKTRYFRFYSNVLNNDGTPVAINPFYIVDDIDSDIWGYNTSEIITSVGKSGLSHSISETIIPIPRYYESEKNIDIRKCVAATTWTEGTTYYRKKTNQDKDSSGAYVEVGVLTETEFTNGTYYIAETYDDCCCRNPLLDQNGNPIKDADGNPGYVKYVQMSLYQASNELAALSDDEFDTMINENLIISTKHIDTQARYSYISNINNTPLKGSELSTKGKIMLLFGDSITETAEITETLDENRIGIMTSYAEGLRVNWPTFAKEILEVGEMWNFAKHGAHVIDYASPDVLRYYRRWLSNQVRMAIKKMKSDNINPDIIVFSAGRNDKEVSDNLSSLGTYETAMSKNLDDLDFTVFYEALRWSLETLRTTFPTATCFIGTPIQEASREQNLKVITAIKEIGRRYNFIVIDAHAESGIVRENEPGLYIKDETGDTDAHPNAAGAYRMAKLYASKILQHF